MKIVSALLSMGIWLIASPSQAQTPSLNPIPSEQAEQLTLRPGRQSIIDFQNGQIIYFVRLADISQIVFSTDIPIDSGAAQSVFLQPINPLNLERPLRTTEGRYPTNITIGTNGPLGRKLYTFNLVINSSGTPPETNSIIIGPETLPEPEEPTSNNLLVNNGTTTASINDIERGIRVALRRGYTRASDPVIRKLDTFLAIARQNTPLIDAAEHADLDFNVVVTLAELGIEDAQIEQQRIEQLPPPNNTRR
ncbi:MAG: hypothetical protein AAGD25_15175 [Cyanobacteria bacterium P01_F01_bin.150]